METAPKVTNPGNPAMSPHTEGEKKQAPVILIKQWKEREGQGRGDSLQGVPTLRRNSNAQKNSKKKMHITLKEISLYVRSLIDIHVS